MEYRINSKYVEEMIAVVNRSPFPHHISMTLLSLDFDSARLSLAIDDLHFQAMGLVHGGVMATLIDTATFWSAYMRLAEEDGLVNIDLKLNYLLPVTQGQLTVEGKCLKAGRSLSYSQASVYDSQGQLCAHGTSTLMTLPGKGKAMKYPKFVAP